MNVLQAYYRLFTPHVLILKIFAGFCAKIQLDQNTLTQLKIDHGVFEKKKKIRTLLEMKNAVIDL